MSIWEIAQVNIALPVVPLSEPELNWFTGALDAVNAAAAASESPPAGDPDWFCRV